MLEIVRRSIKIARVYLLYDGKPLQYPQIEIKAMGWDGYISGGAPGTGWKGKGGPS